MEKLPRVSPPLNWRPISWLCASPSALPAEASAELRALLFNRMSSLLLSALGALIVEIVAVRRHPTPLFIVWLVLDAGMLLWLRVGLVAVITRYRMRHANAASPAGRVSDLFVLVGPLWCATLGYGTGACIASGDLGLSVAGALLAMASIGAVCGRIPGSPRLARLQMILMIVPLGFGGFLTADPLVKAIVALAPIYILALCSINSQLHEDYVEMVVSRQENRRLALRCPLTALPNRRMFDNTLDKVLKGPVDQGTETFVLCLDLDGFKAVNDRLGHVAGDLLLKEVAARLLQNVPSGGLVARRGGDEFAILVTGINPVSAEALASRIVQAIGHPIDVEGKAVQIGVSIGLSRCGGRPENAEDLIREADQALYVAKDAGKNTFRWYQPAAVEIAAVQRRYTDDALSELRAVLDKTPLFRSPIVEPFYKSADTADAQTASTG